MNEIERNSKLPARCFSFFVFGWIFLSQFACNNVGVDGGIRNVEPMNQTNPIVTPSPNPKVSLQLIEMDDFSFKIPSKMKKVKKQGIDTHVLEYRGDEVNLFLEYGNLVGKAIKRLDSRILIETTATVDRKVVPITTFRARSSDPARSDATYVMAFFDDPIGNEKNLILEIECVAESGCAHSAEEILQSLKFR